MTPKRCLLIGNSRWHWADRAHASHWSFRHTDPLVESLPETSTPDRWAAVGRIPAALSHKADQQLLLDQVPLNDAPPWLGIDRALAGWGAWLRSGGGEGVCVVDAGTVLSLTRVTAAGCFGGGWLCAGLRLQLQAMAEGTAALPALGHDVPCLDPCPTFPAETASAMTQGVLQSLLGLIHGAQLRCPAPVWLCGGDAPLLFPELKARGVDVQHTPNLVMETFVDLVS